MCSPRVAGALERSAADRPRPTPAFPRWHWMAKAKRNRKLKVYRTPIGFHDAYVAAPSQKAALEAWGVETNGSERDRAVEKIESEREKYEDALARSG